MLIMQYKYNLILINILFLQVVKFYQKFGKLISELILIKFLEFKEVMKENGDKKFGNGNKGLMRKLLFKKMVVLKIIFVGGIKLIFIGLVKIDIGLLGVVFGNSVIGSVVVQDVDMEEGKIYQVFRYF